MRLETKRSGIDLSDEQFDQSTYKGDPLKSYVICSSPRCGSTYFCSLLTQTGQLGIPFEYLHFEKWAPMLAQRWGMSTSPKIAMEHFFGLVKEHRTTPNGVLGVKAHASQALPLASKGELSQLVGENIPFIHLERRNLILQAISLAIAQATGSFESSTEGRAVAPEYDNRRILKALEIIQKNHNAWHRFFSLNDITPLKLIYEDILEDPAEAVQRVGAYVGVDVSGFEPTESVYKVQRTELNLAWEKQFRAEHSGY